MIAAISAALAAMFSSSRGQDLAIDALRKIGSLDGVSEAQKMQFVLDYLTATKHQSLVRRVIAFMLAGLFVFTAAFWLLAAAGGYLFGFMPALELAGAIKLFLESVLLQPFNLILSFYFVIAAATKLNAK